MLASHDDSRDLGLVWLPLHGGSSSPCLAAKSSVSVHAKDRAKKMNHGTLPVRLQKLSYIRKVGFA